MELGNAKLHSKQLLPEEEEEDDEDEDEVHLFSCSRRRKRKSMLSTFIKIHALFVCFGCDWAHIYVWRNPWHISLIGPDGARFYINFVFCSWRQVLAFCMYKERTKAATKEFN